MSLDLTDDKSTLVPVMAWCRQATSHYLSQCWPSSMSPYGFTRPQWVNMLKSSRTLESYLTCASYILSRHSATSLRMSSPMYSITMVCFSRSRAANNPRPWMLDRRRYTFWRHSTFSLRNCCDLECTKCFMYGALTSPGKTATMVGRARAPVVVCRLCERLKCVRNLGSERAQPVGLMASGISMSWQRPNLKAYVVSCSMPGICRGKEDD